VRPAKRELRHALEGIKVLDLGNFLAGPFGPMLLGDLGATVYKLESPQGDQMRPITEPFNGCQRGKLDVVADLKTAEGLEIAHRLMRAVAVIHHNMRPGVAERLGVDYATAKALNPSVIYCQTTMWGSTVRAATGPVSTSSASRHPVASTSWAATATRPCGTGSDVRPVLRASRRSQCCSLYWRERTGEGQFVDTSILSGGMYINSDVWIGRNGPSPRRRLDAGQTGLGPLYRLYATSDGWIAIVVLSDAQWNSLTTAVPVLAGDERFADALGRQTHAVQLAATLETAFSSGSAADWFTAWTRQASRRDRRPDAPTAWFDDPSSSPPASWPITSTPVRPLPPVRAPRALLGDPGADRRATANASASTQSRS
jgi:crotonobetainyl-CoA:carnitine CoA-transferase CaiB-like acyl-CoA transferase